MRRLAAALLLVAACGDNVAAPPDSSPPRCAPPHGPPFGGLLGDPLAIPLPTSCIEGGLNDALGRWFVVSDDYTDTLGYPRIDGDCASGFRFFGYQDTVEDESGYSSATWSDGTRLVVRYVVHYPMLAAVGPPVPGSEDVYVAAVCLVGSETLAGVAAYQSSFDGITSDPEYVPLTGSHFTRRPAPDGSVALTLLSTVGSADAPDPIPASAVEVDRGTAYVVGPQGLDIVDVSTPTTPVRRAHLDGYYEDILITQEAGRTIAFLSGGRTDVVDVTSPSSPIVLGNVGYYGYRMYLRSAPTGPLLYLAASAGRVHIVDVSDPLDTQWIATVTVPGASPLPFAYIAGVSADDANIYVNDPFAGRFLALDVSAGLATPTISASLDASFSTSHWRGTIAGRQVILHGDAGLIGLPGGMAYLRVVDGDPASPTYFTELGRYQSRREVGIGEHPATVVGTRAYVPYQQDGLRVLDLSHPEQPREIGYYDSWDDEHAVGALTEGAVDVDVEDGLVFVADTERGLVILRDVP